MSVIVFQDMDERLALDMGACCDAIKKSAIALIHGTEDTTIPYQDAATFHTHIPGSQLHLMEGACHNFRNPEHAKRLVHIITDYIITGQLAPGDVNDV
jgi:pimeloyl-ACP methyl ester carboxylesterase